MTSLNLPQIDLSAIRISQDTIDSVGASEKILTTIPIRKPNRQEFIRTRPETEFKVQTYVLELEEDRQVYLIDPKIREELGALVVPKLILTTMSRQGVLFLWPIRISGTDGKSEPWSESALVAARHSETDWVRVSSNMSLKGYEVFKATADLPEPKWPNYTMDQIINIAFRDRYISDPNHDVIKKLRGEI